MKTFPSLVLAAIFSCAAVWPALAQQSFCVDKEAVVVYGNGVKSTQGDVKDSIEDIEDALKNLLPQERFDRLDFDTAYNPTAGLLSDLLETFIQDQQTDTSQFWRILAGLVLMPEALAQAFEDLATAIDEAALVANPTLQAHVDFYKAQILEGKKVLLVAHSQGTLFANQAFFNLTAEEQDGFGIVSAALVDSFVAGGGAYTTLTEDAVVFALFLVKTAAGQPAPLPPNVTNSTLPIPIPSVSAHFFRTSYLSAGSNSRAKLFGDMVATLDALVEPPPTAQEGIITVTLTWGVQPDVDLHVFEPNGTHVYYANLTGLSGFLDVDDVTSFGPEHYFVDCPTLETGTYGVAVNYFRGDGPEDARVLIDAGLITRGFNVPLSFAVGSAGDNSPIGVANINVTGSAGEGFVFEVQ